MESIAFVVAASTPGQEYNVVFTKNGEIVAVSCTCPAGAKRQICKHRVNLINEMPDRILSGNESQIGTAVGWVRGSNLAGLLHDLSVAQSAYEEADAAVKTAKKMLGKALG
ncbi:hypothetical protein [Pseudomonas putida]